MNTTADKPRRVRAAVVRFGTNGKVENGIPSCVRCEKKVRFGFMLQKAPAAFQGEGGAEIRMGGKNWQCWVYCRKCANELG